MIEYQNKWGWTLLELLLVLAIASVMFTFVYSVYCLEVSTLDKINAYNRLVAQGRSIHIEFKQLFTRQSLTSGKAGLSQIRFWHYPQALPKPYRWPKKIVQRHLVGTDVLAIVTRSGQQQAIRYLYLAKTKRFYRNGAVVPALYVSQDGRHGEEYFSGVINMVVDINQTLSQGKWRNQQLLIECLVKTVSTPMSVAQRYYFHGQWQQGIPGFVYQDWPIYILYASGTPDA